MIRSNLDNPTDSPAPPSLETRESVNRIICYVSLSAVKRKMIVTELKLANGKHFQARDDWRESR